MTGVHIRRHFPNDGSVLAYSVRRGGEDEFAIHVLIDVASRRDLPRPRYRGRRYKA